MRKRFTSYKNYADATIDKILLPEELSKAEKLTATENRTVCYYNRNGKFVKYVLPIAAQFSVTTKIITNDFDKDGNQDILLFGNRSDNRLKIGSIDANYGCLLKGNGKGEFYYVSQTLSGLNVVGDVKSVERVNIQGENYLVIGANNSKIQVYLEK